MFQAEEIGLKKGDQILEVNGQGFEHSVKCTRAMEILKGVCHLSITVKSNLLAYQDMLQTTEDSQKSRPRKYNNNLLMESSVDGSLPMEGYGHTARDINTPPVHKTKKEHVGLSGMAGPGASGRFLALSSKQLLNRAFNKFLSKPKTMSAHDGSLVDDVSLAGGSTCASSAASE